MEKTVIFASYFDEFSIEKQVEICKHYLNTNNIKLDNICINFKDIEAPNIVVLSYICLGENVEEIHNKLDILRNNIPKVKIYSIFEESCCASGVLSLTEIFNDEDQNFTLNMQIIEAIKTQKNFLKRLFCLSNNF